MKPIALILALATGLAATAGAATTGAVKPGTDTKTPTQTTASSTKSTTAPKPATTTTAPRAAAAPKADRAPARKAESHSQMNLGFRAIGGSLGYISPENVDGTFLLGVFADAGRITNDIMLEPRIDYWNKSEESFGAKASVRDIIIGARGKYLFQTSNPKLMPFAGAGLSFHMVHAEATIPAMGGFPEQKVEDSTTKLGLDIGGGVATPISPRYDLIGEAWYGIVSDVSQFSLRVGMSYRLGQ